MSVLIDDIMEDSYAQKYQIQKGDRLIEINGHEIMDVLDYRFRQMDRNIKLLISTKENKTREISFKKTEYEEIGLLFDSYLMDEQKSCRNKCIFCFIDQLPKGLRKSLYFKDDDSRLSFLFGNYITLTNVSDHEIDRIIEMHISPINISVHTTNPELRCKMMNNRFAGKALGILKRLRDAGISVNCQIVACPGYNDGQELRHTLQDLIDLQVDFVGVVPVGLTRYREGLEKLEPYNEKTALDTLNICLEYGNMCKEKYGRRIVFPGDEFFIKAKVDIPDADFYEDFSALENGVGLVALLKDELEFALEETEGDTRERRKTLACGESAKPFLQKNIEIIREKFPNINVNVVPIKNNFFGGGINVSGLVVGRDLIEQLKNLDLGSELIIPSVMLRAEGDIFLDDTSTEDVEKALNIKLSPVPNDGQRFLDTVIS
jgi:putative radical SAM enzyme (TIGR03279 family)